MPTVFAGLHDVNGRKYIDVDGIRIKVPWRYNKISGVETKGFKTIYELKPGDNIKHIEFFKKEWNGETFYILKSIEC